MEYFRFSPYFILMYARTRKEKPCRKARFFVVFLFFLFRPRLCAQFRIQDAFPNTQGFGRYFQKLVVSDKFQTLFKAHFAYGYERQRVVAPRRTGIRQMFGFTYVDVNVVG